MNKRLESLFLLIFMAFTLPPLMGAPNPIPSIPVPTVPSERVGPDEELEPDFEDFEKEFSSEPEKTEKKKVFDPLRGYNHFMFKFNDKAYSWLIKPISKGYRFIVPQPLRTAMGRAFHNFHFPLRFANSLLQLKFKQSGIEMGRFALNSTAGIGGFFDPAAKWLRWKSRDEDFGQTLGYYGVGEGFPVVLPFLGPSNLRDMIGMVPDYYSNPLVYMKEDKRVRWVGTAETVNRSPMEIERYEILKKDALDPYTFFRDAYKQNRDRKIKE